MKITILTYGSRGDVQPFLALAVGLQKVGHQVKLAAPHYFAAFASAYRIPFVPLAGDPKIISRRLNDAGTNPIGMVRAINGYIISIAGQVIRQAFAACEDADLIIHSFLFTTGGHSLARKQGIPDVSVQTFPVFAPTCAIPPVSMPNLPTGLLSYVFHWLTTQVFWHGGNMAFKQMKRKDPLAFDLDLHWPFKSDRSHFMTPLVFACSPTVLPCPVDWSPSHIHVPGYLFLDAPDEYCLPARLVDFLAEGEPPICVTFGSMIHRDVDRIYRIILGAVRETQERVIILSGWSDLSGLKIERLLVHAPENILVMDSIPHDWLLPRCKAVIHHGGAGTTAAGLRSGIPNLIIPFAADQAFWGARICSLGAGPRPIPVRKLTVEKLVKALVEVCRDDIRSAAQATGKKVRAEDGVGATIRIITQTANQKTE